MQEDTGLNDFCIHGCYYVDTPQECLLNSEGLPDCRRVKELRSRSNVINSYGD